MAHGQKNPGTVHIRNPIPLSRAILWTPAGAGAGSARAGNPPLLITQGALREVIRHLRSAPDHELLGFLLGELFDDPETGTEYVIVNAAVRTGHVIAEEEPVQIPEAEWLGVQLEVRRRHATLAGWYHSAPFVGPAPLALDLATYRTHFPEPFQCGLVIATSGAAPAGGFFRPIQGDAGAFIPFRELLEDEAFLEGGRKRTLVDWTNYTTTDLVEHDATERRPFVAPPLPPPRPAAPRSVAGAGGEGPGGGGGGGGGGGRPKAGAGSPSPGLPGALPVMIPESVWDEFDAAAPQAAPGRGAAGGGRRFGTRLAVWLGAAAVVIGLGVAGWFALHPSFELPGAGRVGGGGVVGAGAGTGTGAPAADSAGGGAGGGSTAGGGNLTTAVAATGAAATPESARGGPAGAESTAAPARAPSVAAAAPSPAVSRSVATFDRLADSAAVSIQNYHERSSDFHLSRIGCRTLTAGYRSADDAFIALSTALRAARADIDGARMGRYRQIATSMDTLNADFDASHCPRP